MSDERAPLLKALGVDLPDELLTVALTHRSYSYENGGLPTNERLEFLGDAVLGLTITEELYHRHPDRSEGDLAKLRASIVNTQALADVGRSLSDGGLGAHLLLGKGEEHSGGADKSSILADGVESLLGAIYLEHGLSGSREVILRLFRDDEVLFEADLSPADLKIDGSEGRALTITSIAQLVSFPVTQHCTLKARAIIDGKELRGGGLELLAADAMH